MKEHLSRPLLWFVLLVILLSVGCGSPPATPEVQPPVQTDEPETEEPPTATPTQEVVSPEGLVTSIGEAENAVVRIEIEGTYVDPEVGMIMNAGFFGTGFIIDPDGIAVTNNHVVTGAAFLNVYVPGEDRSRNARVLGASECSDLAVIDIEGSGYPYLSWYEGELETAMEVFAAGYPGSAVGASYNLSNGIIMKRSEVLESVWASVDDVIAHSARINPGNSGGPLITRDGEVIGVNYAGVSTTDENYAISGDLAQRIIADLREGVDRNSLGINGIAVTGELEGSELSGIWVRSVKSGSPADRAGVEGGDIIYQIEDNVLALDGTMASYCDILRSHDEDDTMNVTVIRFHTGEVLEGQFNGRELEPTYYFGEAGSGEETETAAVSETTYIDPTASETDDFIVFTEFDDAEYWYPFAVPDTNNYTAELGDSLMYVQVDDINTTVYALFDMDMPISDVRIDAGVETVSGPNRNNISLLCRATTEGWYEFSMNSGGYWYIWKYENGQYERLNYGASNAINLQRAKNELTATCIGTELTFFVNGVEMGSVRDNRFKGTGQVGVSVSTFDIRGAGVEFDWFAASVP